MSRLFLLMGFFAAIAVEVSASLIAYYDSEPRSWTLWPWWVYALSAVMFGGFFVTAWRRPR